MTSSAGWPRPDLGPVGETLLALWLRLTRSTLTPKQQEQFLRDSRLRRLAAHPLQNIVAGGLAARTFTTRRNERTVEARCGRRGGT